MSELFEDLTPPTGGLAGLRVKIERERTPHRARWAIALTAAAALLLYVRPSAPPPPLHALMTKASAPLLVHDGSALLVHDDAKVAIYFSTRSLPAGVE